MPRFCALRTGSLASSKLRSSARHFSTSSEACFRCFRRVLLYAAVIAGRTTANRDVETPSTALASSTCSFSQLAGSERDKGSSREWHRAISPLTTRLPVSKKKKRRSVTQERLFLFYYINLNRTSLDHLLLGVDADVNRCVARVLVQFEFLKS